MKIERDDLNGQVRLRVSIYEGAVLGTAIYYVSFDTEDEALEFILRHSD